LKVTARPEANENFWAFKVIMIIVWKLLRCEATADDVEFLGKTEISVKRVLSFRRTVQLALVA
ncbi:hypothetical protein ACJBTM_10630, partial [Streptococcus suis]